MASINFLTWWNKNKDRIQGEVLSHQWGLVYKYTQEAWENGYLIGQSQAQPEDSADKTCIKCGGTGFLPNGSAGMQDCSCIYR